MLITNPLLFSKGKYSYYNQVNEAVTFTRYIKLWSKVLDLEQRAIVDKGSGIREVYTGGRTGDGVDVLLKVMTVIKSPMANVSRNCVRIDTVAWNFVPLLSNKSPGRLYPIVSPELRRRTTSFCTAVTP